MKVLFISNDPTVFDATSATRARMRTYAKAIGELHILSQARAGAREETDGALVLHPLTGFRLLSLMRMGSTARRIIQANAIEVVSAQDPFEHGWVALQAVKKTSAKLHIQVHTDFLSPWFTKEGVFRSMRIRPPFLNRMRRSIADRVLPHAAGIRVVSQRIKESLLARYGTRIVVPSVLPIAVNAELPDAVALPPHDFAFVFMCSGRLEPEKRIEDVLMALGKIAQRYPSVGLFVVGAGRERLRLEKLSKRLGLAYRVVFMGEQGSAAWGLMRNAHCFIQASAYEGYGRTLIEAALAKIPIITTDVGVVGEVLRGYEEVLATPPGDTQNLAAHMTAIIGDQALRRTLALNAEAAARSHIAHYAELPRLVAEDLSRTIAP